MNYTYWVYKVTFFIFCQIAALIGAVLTLHDAVFSITIEEIDDNNGGIKEQGFNLVMAQSTRS